MDNPVAQARDPLSARTLKAYEEDWLRFSAWCVERHVRALPAAPGVVAMFLVQRAGEVGKGTLRRHLSAIGWRHRESGYRWDSGHPALVSAWRGALRRKERPLRPRVVLDRAAIWRLVATCNGGLTGQRDRALLLLGQASRLNRAELVAIRREDIRMEASFMRIRLGADGGPGKGREVQVRVVERREYCPVRCLQDWLEASDCRFGPVFRRIDRWDMVEHNALCPEAVTQIVRKRMVKAGMSWPRGARLAWPPRGARAS